MNEIVQHIPTFVDRDEPAIRSAFTTVADLEAIPFVAWWKKTQDFLRFSKADKYLMAEFSPTKAEPAGFYWVVGYLRDPTAVDLPQWVENEAHRKQREAWNRGAPRRGAGQ